MAKKGKKKTRRRAKTTFSIAVLGPIINEFFQGPFPRLKEGNWGGAANSIVADYTGYDMFGKTWRLDYLKNGAGPLLIGSFVHKLANKFGINRALANAGVPWARI